VTNSNPLILIHGIDDSVILFEPLKAFLQGRRTIHYFDLVPNNGEVGLEKLAGQVATYISNQFCGRVKLDLVGFSMGGLVARYYIQRMSGLGRVQRLITVSTPHRGTWTAFLRWNTAARQMRPGSEFLEDLNKDSEVLRRIQFTSIWTPFDLMIVPAASSVMPEARSIPINVLAHPLMMRDARALRLVEQALAA
jgi:triacylglycerol lipase